MCLVVDRKMSVMANSVPKIGIVKLPTTLNMYLLIAIILRRETFFYMLEMYILRNSSPVLEGDFKGLGVQMIHRHPQAKTIGSIFPSSLQVVCSRRGRHVCGATWRNPHANTARSGPGRNNARYKTYTTSNEDRNHSSR